ncbi:GntR family transcriptional regulator [Gemmobacter sp.]|uniref:GntR family transcriptional regulator n=1 Tax=Gemmobacter sp. TaxID=1898957 RepID=UPI002AFE289F|nr:GntR family transcriptional regulator [Gemmobacter sp.]
MGATPLHDRAYAALKEALLEGRIPPGQPVTVASLAALLGAGTMPMREAVRRLTAEGGLSASETRRLTVPALGHDRFQALMRARLLLEPEAAADALPHLDAAAVAALSATDAALSKAIRARDLAAYMRLNYRFHFGIYRATPGSVLAPLIESLWLQFGPWMHLLFDQAPSHLAADRHQAALAAIRAGDEPALRTAIAADIRDALATLQAAQGA